MARKKKQTVREKNIKRILNQIKHAETKGMRWSEEFKQSLYSMSTQKLKEMTRYKVLREGTAISPKTGKIISARQAETEYRSMAQKVSRNNRKFYEKYGETIELGKAIRDQLWQMVNDFYPKPGAIALGNLLAKEEATYGVRLYQALAQVEEEVLAEAQMMVQLSKETEELRYHYNKIANLIRGAMPTEIEAKQDGGVMDEDYPDEEFEE